MANPYAKGRPTKLTAVTQRRICALIRKGVPRERAARLAGINPGTFHRWMAQGEAAQSGIYREFRDEVCKADDDLVRKAISTVTDLLATKREDGSTREDAVRLNAAKFVLSHRFNREFSTRQEVTGAEGGAVKVEATVAVRPLLSDDQVRELTPEQLEAAIGALVNRGGEG